MTEVPDTFTNPVPLSWDCAPRVFKRVCPDCVTQVAPSPIITLPALGVNPPIAERYMFVAMYGRLSYEYPSKRSAFRFVTRYCESTVNGGVDPDVPPLNAGLPVTTSLSDKLKYEGEDAAHMGSDSTVRNPPVTYVANVILPLLST